jgi:hypothetical protein
MATVPSYKHISFECSGDGCWHTPDGYFWVFDNTRPQELVPVSIIVGFFERHAAERHKAAVDIQRIWRGTSSRRREIYLDLFGDPPGELEMDQTPRAREIVVSFGDHIVVRDENEKLLDIHHRMKTFDGPNPQSLIFAEMIDSFFTRKWCNEIQLLEQYGSKFVSDNQDTFSVIFRKAMIQMINGEKWGLWKGQTAVDPGQPNHLTLFTECSQAFRKAMVLIKILDTPSNYMYTPSFCGSKCINVN